MTVRTCPIRRPASTLAFVDLRQPIWPEGAHVLVVPKPHIETIDGLPDALAGELMRAVVRVAREALAVRLSGRLREPAAKE